MLQVKVSRLEHVKPGLGKVFFLEPSLPLERILILVLYLGFCSNLRAQMLLFTNLVISQRQEQYIYIYIQHYAKQLCFMRMA